MNSFHDFLSADILKRQDLSRTDNLVADVSSRPVDGDIYNSKSAIYYCLNWLYYHKVCAYNNNLSGREGRWCHFFFKNLKNFYCTYHYANLSQQNFVSFHICGPRCWFKRVRLIRYGYRYSFLPWETISSRGGEQNEISWRNYFLFFHCRGFGYPIIRESDTITSRPRIPLIVVMTQASFAFSLFGI